MTQREEKHILPVTFESQWVLWCTALDALQKRNGNVVYIDPPAWHYFCHGRLLISCWHWWSQTSAGPSRFMMVWNQLDSTTPTLELTGSQACVRLIICQLTSRRTPLSSHRYSLPVCQGCLYRPAAWMDLRHAVLRRSLNTDSDYLKAFLQFKMCLRQSSEGLRGLLCLVFELLN